MQRVPWFTASRTLVLALTAGWMSVGNGHAADAAPAPAPVATPAPPQHPWETSAAAGLTLSRGNTKSLLLSLSLDTKKKWEGSEAAFGLSGGYGEQNKVRSTEFLTGFGDYHVLATKRFYGGLHLDGTYDGIASLDYRARFSPLVGYYLIKNETTSLNVEAGPSLVLERYAHRIQEGYWGARFGEKFEHKLSTSTKVWQSLDYVPRVDRWREKYVVSGEVGIDTAITKKWSLRTVLQDVYDSAPAANRVHNDVRLIAGTAYKF